MVHNKRNVFIEIQQSILYEKALFHVILLACNRPFLLSIEQCPTICYKGSTY